METINSRKGKGERGERDEKREGKKERNRVVSEWTNECWDRKGEEWNLYGYRCSPSFEGNLLDFVGINRLLGG